MSRTPRKPPAVEVEHDLKSPEGQMGALLETMKQATDVANTAMNPRITVDMSVSSGMKHVRISSEVPGDWKPIFDEMVRVAEKTESRWKKEALEDMKKYKEELKKGTQEPSTPLVGDH